MKIQINSPHLWIEILLKQYFVTLEQGDDLVIDDLDAGLNIALKGRITNWNVTKPFTIFSLVNMLEQAKEILAENISIGPISFYPNQRFCLYEGEEINLTQKESEILLYLASHQYYIDKLTLLDAIWGYSSDITTHTLETHIHKLRNKFIDKYDIILSSEDGYALNLIAKP